MGDWWVGGWVNAIHRFVSTKRLALVGMAGDKAATYAPRGRGEPRTYRCQAPYTYQH